MRTAPGRHCLVPSMVIRVLLRATLMTGGVTAVRRAEAAVLPAVAALVSASAAIVIGRRVLWMVLILLPLLVEWVRPQARSAPAPRLRPCWRTCLRRAAEVGFRRAADAVGRRSRYRREGEACSQRDRRGRARPA